MTEHRWITRRSLGATCVGWGHQALNIEDAKNAGKPRAYSYVRFSTPEQAQGDSYRRQIESAEEYARLHDLEMDAKLRFADRGLSAYRGANAEIG